MLSICVPIYNYDASDLIRDLRFQMNSLNIPSELILIDDGSSHHQESNRSADPDATYIELPQNIGRARIRNLFLDYAQYDYLLFLDCDSRVLSPTFLEQYIESIAEKPSVIYGGRIYDNVCPSPDQKLSWKYGRIKESHPANLREKNPHKSFMTNNFLIRRDILMNYPFDERITQYGHEDTLFGLALKRNHIPILHIDNPVLNGEIETNEAFLLKSEEAVANLVSIIGRGDYSVEELKDIKLLRAYLAVKPIQALLLHFFHVVKPTIRSKLVKGQVNLTLFDIYKLGILLEKVKSKNI